MVYLAVGDSDGVSEQVATCFIYQTKFSEQTDASRRAYPVSLMNWIVLMIWLTKQ